jgi:hypothetical protein
MSKKYQKNLDKIAKLQKKNSDMLSGGSDDILKAIYANGQKSSNQKSDVKSAFVNSETGSSNNSLGRKLKPGAVGAGMLRAMASTPIIYAIISTRVDQVASFSVVQKNKYELGFTVRPKGKDLLGGENTIDPKTQKKIKEIEDFVLNCGSANNHFHESDFEDYLRQTTFASLILDNDCTEIVRARNGKPLAFIAIDGATIYRAISEAEAESNNQTDILGEKVDGFYPSHVQVLDQTKINAEYYPWEIEVSTRNRSTDIRRNGYGQSELEILIQTITWMLYGDRYNGNFFSNGSAPKGILQFSEGMDQTQMKSFRQEWQAMMQGSSNSWKIPMLSSDVSWIDLQKSNTDMQFGKWQEYLLKISCAVFKISPEEIGYNLSSGGKSIFQGSQEEQLTHSQNRGLKPILRKKARVINNIIQSNPDWTDFELVFSGLGVESEKEEVDLDIKKMQYMTVDEIRLKNGLEALGGVEGSVISNPNVTQNLQMDLQKQSQESLMTDTEGAASSDAFIDGLLGENGSVTDSSAESTSANSANNDFTKSLMDYYLIEK